MEIEFENAPEDLSAMAVFHLTNTPSGRALMRKQMIGAGIGTLLGVGLVFVLYKRPALALFAALIGVLLTPLVVRPILLRSAARNVKLMVKGQNTQGTLGWHRLRLEDQVLVEESEAGSTTVKLGSLEGLGIYETPGHVFVYLNAAVGHPIPRHRILRGDLDEFVARLRAQVQGTAGEMGNGSVQGHG